MYCALFLSKFDRVVVVVVVSFLFLSLFERFVHARKRDERRAKIEFTLVHERARNVIS